MLATFQAIFVLLALTRVEMDNIEIECCVEKGVRNKIKIKRSAKSKEIEKHRPRLKK
jgi:hypothetical protein